MDACSLLVLVAITAVAVCGFFPTTPERTWLSVKTGADSEVVVLIQCVLLLGL